MLSCEQCRKYLGFYLDQALGVKESLEVQEHLQECQECTDLAAAECSLRAVVRQQAVTAPLPEADKRRLIRVAMQQPRHSWSWLAKLRETIQWRDVGLGAAVTAAVLLVFLSPVRDLLIGHDAARKIMHETALAYHTYLHHDVPMEVETNDDFHLARWANDVVDRNFRVPCITDETAQLVGGRVCRLRDRKGLAMKYRHQDSDLLVFAFRDASLSLPNRRMTPTEAGDFYVRHVAGRPVILWQRAGVTYSLVGDIDHQALLRVAGTVRYLHAKDTGHNVTPTTSPRAPVSGQ